MELQLEQQQISCMIPCANRSLEERFSADFVVPDSLPDASELLLTEGNLCLWRLDLSDGSAELEGEISARICFADGSGVPVSFPARIPIQLRLRAEAIEMGQRPFLRCRIKSLSGHMLNSRKVRLQGMVFCSLATYGSSEITVTTGISAEGEGIFVRKTSMMVPYISAVEEQVFTVEETLPLLRGVPMDGRLISFTSTPVSDTCECRDQSVILKGRIRTTLLYQDHEDQDLVTEVVDTPFTCLLDVSGEASKCKLSLHLTSEDVRCRNDDPAVDTAFHLLAQVICYAERDVECVSDAYSNRAVLNLSWKEQSFPEYAQSEITQSFVEQEIPCELAGKTVSAVRIFDQGESIAVTVMIRDAEQKFNSVAGVLKTEISPDCVVWLDQPSVRSGNSGLIVRVPILVQKETETPVSVGVLSSAELEDKISEMMPGFTLVRREECTDLWELAKTNKSSMKAIQAANPEREQQSRWLVIPHVV